MAESFYITTLGCPKNIADSREMERSMSEAGFSQIDDPERADYHLINTCAFIEDARLETIQTTLDAALVKKARPGQKLILAGCFTERYAAEIKADLPEVDYAFGTGQYHLAGELLAAQFRTGRPESQRSAQGIGAELKARGVSAPVKISDGCDRSCSFCAIPSFRGSFRSLTPERILAECRRLSSEGVREICLVSQDTNSYGNSPDALLDLIEQINLIDGLHWIRLLYLYPDKKTEKILKGLGERRLPKVVPYFESPIQHASPRMLKAMKRAGDAEFFHDLFSLARSALPECEIRTTFLLGFPGEKEGDVEEIMAFLERSRPEKVALFPYSPEEGTSGFMLADSVPSAVSTERVNRIRTAHLSILRELHAERLGKVYRCILDGFSRDGKQAHCRRPQDAPDVDEIVFVERQGLLPGAKAGDLIDLQIDGSYEYDMTARRAPAFLPGFSKMAGVTDS